LTKAHLVASISSTAVLTEAAESTCKTPTDNESGLELIWGAKNIAKEIGQSERMAFYLLEKSLIPGTKIGGRWCTSRGALKRRFEALAVKAA
jgi:hypothetical protein